MKRFVQILAAALLGVALAGAAAATTYIAPLQKLRFVDANGNALVGGKLFSYIAGTTTKQTTYTDQTGGTPNADPIVLDGRGEANVWLTAGAVYKFTLSPATDTDPPTSPIWTVDNISGIDDLTNVTSTFLTIAQAAASSPPTGASLIGYKSTASSAIASTVQKRLQSLFIDVVADYGAVGDGVTNTTSSVQNALNGVQASGGTVYFPPGNYVCGPLTPKPNTLIVLDPGATLTAIGGAPNTLFALSNTELTTTNMSASSATTLTVTNSAGFNVGDRIIISGGTFTGSGVEEGPIEFNTVAAVPNGSTITVTDTIKYNYAGFGLPGASPNVKRLGTGTLRNVRITGGNLVPANAFNSVYFLLTDVEDVEIDHLHMIGIGSNIATGHRISRLNMHDNVLTGTSPAGVNATGMDVGIVESRIVNNIFASLWEQTTGTIASNHFVCEVVCRDNLFDGNFFGPVRNPGSGAIELTFYSFNNRITNNRILGLDADVAAAVVTLGIRTYANGANIGGGNVIVGNTINDIFTGIGDGQSDSIIVGNRHKNLTLQANSVTVLAASDTNVNVIGPNVSVNVGHPVQGTGAVGGLAIYGGTGAPSTSDAQIGSIYMKKNGAAGGAAHQFRDLDENGFPNWLFRNQPPRVLFANIGTPANGTMLYVPDGTAASNPLTGGGTGCFAIRQNGAWKGL